MVKEKQKLPDWFDGECYTRGDLVMNRFTGDGIKLTAEELSMYDFIMGCAMVFENTDLNGRLHQLGYEDFDKGRDWFRKTNPEAYMILLD